MTSATAYWPLQHQRSLTGRVRVTQGPRATLLTEADLIDLLKRVRRANNTTGVVRTANGIALDESQLVNLYDTYFVDEQAPDIDPDRHVLGFHAEEAHEVTAGPWVDEHGFDHTPGQWPIGGAL